MADRTRELSALLSSAALVLVGGIIASVAKLGERVVIGRLLSPDAYGEVSVGLALLTFTVTFALAGTTQGVSRYVPRYEDRTDQRGVWVSGLLVAGTLALVGALGLFLAAEWLAATFFETAEAVTFVRLLALALPFTVGFRIAVAGIRGYENTVFRTVAEDFVDPFLRIGLIGLLLLAGMGIVAAGVAYLLAAVATFLVAHLLFARLMPLRGPFRTHTRELVRFSAPLVVSTVVGVMLTRTDTLMLGYFRSSYEVGIYDAAYPLANGLLVALTAFGFLYLPIASRLDADDDRDAVDDIYATTTKWVYVLTFPAFCLFVVFPRDVIHLFFGPAYTDAALVLPILATGFFLSAAAGRDRETLSAVGATTWIAVGNVVGLTLNVVVNLLLIPRYGYVGAAVASVTSLIALHGVICAILAIRYDITPLSPAATRAYLSLPVVLLPAAVLLSPWLSVSILTLVPFLVVAGLASLAVVGLAGGLEPDDVVVLDLLEEAAGFEFPYVRHWIPDSRETEPLLASVRAHLSTGSEYLTTGLEHLRERLSTGVDRSATLLLVVVTLAAVGLSSAANRLGDRLELDRDRLGDRLSADLERSRAWLVPRLRHAGKRLSDGLERSRAWLVPRLQHAGERLSIGLGYARAQLADACYRTKRVLAVALERTRERLAADLGYLKERVLADLERWRDR
ncbi:oligosaccharide flippase family protein [Natronobeatus ordinarius]|uniref:oligosaccharide flippase family protein n=1 Tax=Natronobeatus ordinarius TaxID=2963433 RepID=UPI0020CEDCC5|nr:oligosaccharide flippase family protein [Natronobeatus ordinarius]